MSETEAPLIEKVKEGAFIWSDAAQRAFDKFKHVMPSCLVLTNSDSSPLFICLLGSDISSDRIGAISMQKRQAITFERRKLRLQRGHLLFMKTNCLSLYMLWLCLRDA